MQQLQVERVDPHGTRRRFVRAAATQAGEQPLAERGDVVREIQVPTGSALLLLHAIGEAIE